MKEKPILEGPIFFHFHDYGRKGIFGSPIWNFGVKISLEYIDVFFLLGLPFLPQSWKWKITLNERKTNIGGTNFFPLP